jgi:hypothetical protein
MAECTDHAVKLSNSEIIRHQKRRYRMSMMEAGRWYRPSKDTYRQSRPTSTILYYSTSNTSPALSDEPGRRQPCVRATSRELSRVMCRASKEQRTARHKSDFPETTCLTDEQTIPPTYRTSLAVAVKTLLNMRFEIVVGAPNMKIGKLFR